MGIHIGHAKTIYEESECCADVELYKDKLKIGKGKQGPFKSVTLSAAMQGLIAVSKDAKSVTTVLGAEENPTMNLRDVLLTGGFAKFRSTILPNESVDVVHALSSLILKEREPRLGGLYKNGSTSYLLVSSSTFVFPVLHLMNHSHQLSSPDVSF